LNEVRRLKGAEGIGSTLHQQPYCRMLLQVDPFSTNETAEVAAEAAAHPRTWNLPANFAVLS